jgi:hypothetical protein
MQPADRAKFDLALDKLARDAVSVEARPPVTLADGRKVTPPAWYKGPSQRPSPSRKLQQ